LLDFLDVRTKEAYPLDFFITEEERHFAEQWAKEKGVRGKALVGMHPGASTFKNHDRKKWAAESFAALIDMLTSKLKDSAFLLFGGPEEQGLRRTVMSSVRHADRVLNAESLSVRQAASLMMKCSLFVSNDSGPMHMAAATRVPTVAIFGPTNPVWVRPWGVPNRVVRACEACKPCFRYSPVPMYCVEGRDFACLREITVEQVFSACRDLLGS
jgi:heptosyltransferase-2